MGDQDVRYASVADAARQADILQRVLNAISSGLALEPLLTSILESAVSLIDATHGTIGLVTERAGEPRVRTVAVVNMPPQELGAEMSPGAGLAGHVLQTGEAICLARYGDLEQMTLPELSEHPVIGMPIRWGERMIGFFGIGADPPRRFDAHNVQTLGVFAQYAAVVIHNARLFEATERLLDETRLLYETSQRIGLATDVDEVIRAYLEQVAAGGQYACTIVLYEFDEAGNRTAVMVRGRWTRQAGLQQAVKRLPYTRDALDPLLDAGNTVLIDDVNQDPRVSDELRALQARDGRPALAMMPLMVRGQRIGLVILSAARVHHWQTEEMRPYQATANQLALFLDSRRGQELLFQRGQELAVLQERQRLARELHDSVTQQIFSAMLVAQSLGAAYRRDLAEGEQRVEQLLALCQSTLGEMRALLLELHPAKGGPDAPAGPPPAVERIRRFGLQEALDLLAADFERHGLAVEFSARLDGATSRLCSAEAAEAAYRIAQEALNNTIKHARARTARIELAMEQAGPRQWLRLTVSDNGRGFDPQASAARRVGGFGIVSMRERAELLGGTWEIGSTPGKGTQIQARLPIGGKEG